MNMFLKIGPVIALIFMTWYALHERDLKVQAIEQCNTEKMAAIAESERITRDAVTSSLEDRIRQLESTALDAARARDIAIQARIEAEARPVKTVEVIRRIESENSCLSEPIPDELIDTLRVRTD